MALTGLPPGTVLPKPVEPNPEDARRVLAAMLLGVKAPDRSVLEQIAWVLLGADREKELVAEVTEMTDNYNEACQTMVLVFTAAMGIEAKDFKGFTVGPVEDVKAERTQWINKLEAIKAILTVSGLDKVEGDSADKILWLLDILKQRDQQIRDLAAVIGGSAAGSQGRL